MTEFGVLCGFTGHPATAHRQFGVRCPTACSRTRYITALLCLRDVVVCSAHRGCWWRCSTASSTRTCGTRSVTGGSGGRRCGWWGGSGTAGRRLSPGPTETRKGSDRGPGGSLLEGPSSPIHGLSLGVSQRARLRGEALISDESSYKQLEVSHWLVGYGEREVGAGCSFGTQYASLHFPCRTLELSGLMR